MGFIDRLSINKLDTCFISRLPVISLSNAYSNPRSAKVAIAPISNGLGMRYATPLILNHQKLFLSHSSRFFQSSSSWYDANNPSDTAAVAPNTKANRLGSSFALSRPIFYTILILYNYEAEFNSLSIKNQKCIWMRIIFICYMIISRR